MSSLCKVVVVTVPPQGMAVQYWLAHITTAGIFQIMTIDPLTCAPACDITLLSAPLYEFPGDPESV